MLNIDFSKLMAGSVGDENGLTKSDMDAISKLTSRGHDQIQRWRKTKDAIFYDIASDGSMLKGKENVQKCFEFVKKNYFPFL